MSKPRPPIPSDLRQLIRERAADLGWSQAEIARRAGVRVATVNKLLGDAGEVHLSIAQRVADAMGGIDVRGWATSPK